MTYEEAYTSLKSLYKQMMFPPNPHTPKWTLAEIDQLDVHFFSELLDAEGHVQEKDQYLSEVW
ncbi:hypothetical protein HNQ94_000403 [Salirhabdus euzebyi]|uniref:Uncharacterized protein n=1 Tax=Salirhabdus euzebyi TaxID=394506 RepID=A0A841Q1K3_9BACI|nr:hypothetical protein [Salirhabdus euzebyi]MBB6451982.1 hypothetical protein [Salirhabdus euzebyi]